MANIKKYTMKDGSTRYMFQAYLGTDEMTGKRIRVTRQGFATRKDAQLELSRLKLEVAEKGFKKRSYDTFGELYETWLETTYKHTVKESTLAKTEELFHNHILPAFEDKRVEKINVMYCQQVVNEWFSKLTKYNTMRNYVTRVFEYAVHMGIRNDNPMKKIVPPRKRDDVTEEKRLNFYDKEELQAFLEACKKEADPKWHVLFRLLAFSGMRRGEAIGLTWSDINFIDGTVRINKALARGKDNRLIIQTPKTAAGVRTISLDPITLGTLKEWRTKQATDFLKLGVNTNKPAQLIFTNDSNEFMQHSNITNVINRVIKKNDLKRITTHGLRHTHCSLLFEAGASIQEVKERLGHSDIQTTMNIYTHVTEKAKEQTAERFANYVGF